MTTTPKSTPTERYVAPPLRRALEFNAGHSLSPSLSPVPTSSPHSIRYQSPSNVPDKRSFSPSRFNFNPRRSLPNIGLGKTGKWKEGSVKYGTDGLCPVNTRLEMELFNENSSYSTSFEKYEDIPIEIDGQHFDIQEQTFMDFELGPVINHNLNLAKFTVPTPIQKASVPIIMKRRDLMACAQTGSGKTFAFLGPIISLLIKSGTDEDSRDRRKVTYPECLILAPTRELAIQIHFQARKFTYRSHLKTVCVYGGADFRTQAFDIEKGCNILVATPGRLLDMMERGKISLDHLRFLAIDEADRMLDMGFEPQIQKIVEYCPGTDIRQTLMFSATFPKSIQRLAKDFLKDYVFLRVGRVGSTTDNITQRIWFVEEGDKKDALLEVLSSVDGLTLVFVETKRSVDCLEEFLYSNNFSVISIHGDRSQKEREAALEAFRTQQARILVATDVAARGLDVKDVKHVINYDMPHDIDDYVHRIGRTGRCGTEGLATAFFNDKNRSLARDLVSLLEESAQTVDPWLSQYASSSFGSRSGTPRLPNKRNNRIITRKAETFISRGKTSFSNPGWDDSDEGDWK